MKKLDLSNYLVTVKVKDGEQIVDRQIPYDVKGSIRGILFHADQRLSGIDLMENFKLAEKIAAAEGSILLEKDDYNRLKKSFDAFRGFGENDVELVKRILDAPEVQVKEDPHPTQVPDQKPL
jgi:predicted glycosyltransferase involved in capsule biosynthesis